MLGFSGRHLINGFVAIICVMGGLSLALAYFIPAPPTTLVIATGAKGQTYEAIATKYKEILARSGVELEIRLSKGADENIALLNSPALNIKVGFGQGGLSDGEHSPDLLSLGRINYQIYWLFVQATDTLGDLRLLRGRRVVVGPEGSGQRATTTKILAASGVTSENTTLLDNATLDAAKALEVGQIDAFFLPIAIDAPILRPLLSNPRIRPVSFAEAEAYTRMFPFLVRLELPRAVVDFEHVLPATDITLLGVTNNLLVRQDTHPALIDLLARALVQVHGKAGVFQKAGDFPTLTDPEFPMAQSAQDFYKNGPSFLSRYLPFWMISHVQRLIAVLFTVVAIILPLFTYAPKLLRWFVRERTLRLYRRLRAVEAQLETDASSEHLSLIRSELDKIDGATTGLRLPARYSDIVFGLKSHVNLMRIRLAARLAEAAKAVVKIP